MYTALCYLFQSLPVRDAVRECLEKDPADRKDDDIEILLDFMQHFRVSMLRYQGRGVVEIILKLIIHLQTVLCGWVYHFHM